MKLFSTLRGFVFAFGFDPIKRSPNPRMIHWCDPDSGSWDISASNQAGSHRMSFTVAPEFVRECDGKVIAYQPGKCIEATYIGPPDVWSIRTLQSDQSEALVA